jgi:lysozyme family protein
MASLRQTAIDRLIDEEGGYVNHPEDDGGETLYGIARNFHPPASSPIANQFWGLVDRLKSQGLPPNTGELRKIAAEIYAEKYWIACRCDELPPAVAVMVFDSAVQHGTARRRDDAPAMLQRALGVTDDGVIGPVTLRAASEADQPALLAEFFVQRILHYTALRDWVHFGKGWSRRLVRMYTYALQFADPHA